MNVIYGRNAQGKTNLLEAVWLFTGGRSFRGARDGELVAFGQEKAALHLQFYSEEREQEAELTIQNGRRSASLNGVPKRSPAELVGQIPRRAVLPGAPLPHQERPGAAAEFHRRGPLPGKAGPMRRFCRGITTRWCSATRC